MGWLAEELICPLEGAGRCGEEGKGERKGNGGGKGAAAAVHG